MGSGKGSPGGGGADNVVRKGWVGGQIFVGLDKIGWSCLSYDRCSEYFVDWVRLVRVITVVVKARLVVQEACTCPLVNLAMTVDLQRIH